MEGLVAHYDFTTGSLLSKIDGAPAVNHGAEFKLTEKGMALRFDGSSYAEVANNDIVGTNDFSVVVWVKDRPPAVYADILSNNMGSGSWGINLSTQSAINGSIWFEFYPGWGTRRWVSFGSISHDSQWHCLIATIDRDGYLKVYLDGNYVNQIDISSDDGITVNSQNLFIGKNSVGSNMTGDIADVQIYVNKILSQTEIDDIQIDFLASKSLLPAKRHFAHLKPTELTEDGLVAAFNMKPTGNKLIDISGGGNEGQITNCVSTKDGLRSYGANMNSKVTFSPAILDGATTWTIVTKFRDYERILNDVYLGGIAQRNLWLGHNGKLGFKDDGNNYHDWDGTGNTVNAPYTDIENKEVDLIWVADGININVYVNGVDKGYITPVSPSSTRIYIIKLFEGYANDASAVKMTMQEVLIYNTAKDEEFAKAYHSKWADDVYLKEDFEGNGADGIVKVPRGWNANGTGLYSIGELSSDDAVLTDLTAGTKYLECDTNGTAAIQSKIAYGTFEFIVYHGGVVNRTNFISDRFNATYEDFEGYTVYFYNGKIYFSRANVGGRVDLFITAASYISNNTYYGIMVTRTPDGEFTAYIKGGAFGNEYVLIDVTGGSGTNPVTSTTYTESEYFVVDNDANDKILDIKLLKGVIQ